MSIKTNLKEIPGVGKKIESALINLGYGSMDDLKGEDPKAIYDRDCALRGMALDRCLLYVYRLAVTYAEGNITDPKMLKWWYWKDK